MEYDYARTVYYLFRENFIFFATILASTLLIILFVKVPELRTLIFGHFNHKKEEKKQITNLENTLVRKIDNIDKKVDCLRENINKAQAERERIELKIDKQEALRLRYNILNLESRLVNGSEITGRLWSETIKDGVRYKEMNKINKQINGEVMETIKFLEEEYEKYRQQRRKKISKGKD